MRASGLGLAALTCCAGTALAGAPTRPPVAPARAFRLDRAREMLRSGSMRVIDAAYAVGFSDASHFHRLFKQRFGRTPGEMRHDR